MVETVFHHVGGPLVYLGLLIGIAPNGIFNGVFDDGADLRYYLSILSVFPNSTVTGYPLQYFIYWTHHSTKLYSEGLNTLLISGKTNA